MFSIHLDGGLKRAMTCIYHAFIFYSNELNTHKLTRTTQIKKVAKQRKALIFLLLVVAFVLL